MNIIKMIRPNSFDLIGLSQNLNLEFNLGARPTVMRPLWPWAKWAASVNSRFCHFLLDLIQIKFKSFLNLVEPQ
jgi:hypothetical protein